MNRRIFLSLLGLAPLAASTKTYSFLGNIFRKSVDGDNIIWKSTGGFIHCNKWFVYSEGGKLGQFSEGDIFQVSGGSLLVRVEAHCELKNGLIVPLPIPFNRFSLHDGETLRVNFPDPAFKVDIL